MDSSNCKPHFLLLPLPEQGHITPMLSLASRLAALGCTITFLKAQKAPFSGTSQNEEESHQLAEDEGNILEVADAQFGLRFRTLRRAYGGVSSQPIDAASCSRFDVLKHTLAGLEERQGIVEQMVQESNPPISCIICDYLLGHWVLKVAKRQAIQAALLVPCAAINFYAPYLSTIGKGNECEELYRQVGLLELNNININVTNEEQRRRRRSEMFNWLSSLYEGVEEASHILMNSFKHLESTIVESIEASKLNIQFIGPCLPAWEDGNTTSTLGDIMAKQAGCLHSEELACLNWLDRQEKASVLLISFGSEAILEAEQVQELAMGLEASGSKFLWVVRADTPSYNMPPDDFQERTRHVGMCVSWAPQRKVLQHFAIGGFLTHCGWNSTLESMFYGVPMLCFPMNADQFCNAHLIHKHWKVGIPLRTSILVSREDVQRAVQTVLGSHDLHQCVTQYKEAAQCALLESHKSLASFVRDIAKRSPSYVNCNKLAI